VTIEEATAEGRVQSGIHNGKRWVADYREWFDLDSARSFLERDRFARRLDGSRVRYQQGCPVAAAQFAGGRYVICQYGVVLWSY
jgi:hypothetical protein